MKLIGLTSIPDTYSMLNIHKVKKELILMKCCSNLDICGFVKKYKETKKLAVKGFINMFCMGERQTNCERKKYKELHGCPPSDDMMPNGSLVKR
jgi:hypothetical protein